MRRSNIIFRTICLCTLSVLGGLSISAYSQNRKIDSLRAVLSISPPDTGKVTALISLAREFGASKTDSAFLLDREAFRLAQKLNWENGMASALHGIGSLYYLAGRPDSALYYYNRSYERWKKIFPPFGGAKGIVLLGNIGVMYDDQGDRNNALKYCNEALDHARSINDSSGMAKNFGNIGVIYKETGNYPQALHYYFLALDLKKALGNKKEQALTLGNIGIIYKDQGDYPRALDHYLKALKLTEEIGDKKGSVRNLNNIGILYYLLGDLDNALEHHQKAYRIATEIKDKRGMNDNLGSIASDYWKLKRFTLALRYYTREMGVADSMKDRLSVCRITGDEGAIYKDLGDSALRSGNRELANELYDKAVQLDKNAIDLAAKLHAVKEESDFTTNLGCAYTALKKNAEAEKCFILSLELARSIHHLEGMKELEFNFYLLDSARGNFNGAFSHYKNGIAYRDSLFNNENVKKQTQLEMRFDFDKKTAADSVKVAEEKKVVAAELKSEQGQRYSLYGGLILVLIFAGAMFNRFRVTQKQKLIIERQKEVVEEQKKIVEEKNKDILDSIHYARRIQRAL
ncbi:MAG TPA: tetratricopeptide repeat protein, partial [Bacteroidia bacterium]